MLVVYLPECDTIRISGLALKWAGIQQSLVLASEEIEQAAIMEEQEREEEEERKREEDEKRKRDEEEKWKREEMVQEKKRKEEEHERKQNALREAEDEKRKMELAAKSDRKPVTKPLPLAVKSNKTGSKQITPKGESG